MNCFEVRLPGFRTNSATTGETSVETAVGRKLLTNSSSPEVAVMSVSYIICETHVTKQLIYSWPTNEV